MATPAHTTKSITNDFQNYKEKENRRPQGLLNRHQLSSNSGSNGSVPKRYQSVFTEGTPLASFGVRNDNNQQRSHSPPNHIQPQLQQRPLKPVKEFLTTQSIVDQQQFDDHRRLSSHINGHSRSQTDATIQNVNVALTKTLNKLRQEPSHTATTNGRSTTLYGGSTTFRPMINRATSHQNTNSVTAPNFYYQLPGGTKGPLPVELITRRATNSLPTNNLSNGVTHNRISNGIGPLIVQQPIALVHHETRSTENVNTRASTPFRLPAKSLDTGLYQTDGFNLNSVTRDEHSDRFRISKYDSNQQVIPRSTSSKRIFSPRVPNVDNQHRSLPEVSVNPQIQSSVQKSDEQLSQLHEPLQNGLSNEQIHSSAHENHTNHSKHYHHHHHHHHHINVEPTNTFKRTTSPLKYQQIADVHPNVIVQHQRSTIGTNSSSTKDPFNEAYIERDNVGTQIETHTNNNNNDSTSTLKYYENQQERKKNLMTPPPSPATQELNPHRPPGRLKNYEDETETETTATETQSKDEDMTRRHGLPPSDLGSDAWSDLTSEFSDTKFRKHPNIRTSTPNMTRQSSSQSSKEVGQIRKQLSDLQVMYSDLLKLLDVDIESMRSSHKSSTSSQADHNSRRHRFRKVMPVTSMRQSNIDMREVNQRFTRLETSIVTLAESIAKLSAQIQMQRVIKDDVYQLRQEVAELRQQIHHHKSSPPVYNPSIPPALPPPPPPPPTTTTQQSSRLISPNIQRLATVNSTNPLNISTSYLPSTSTIQRSTSIIDPRQARKIEQFFGREAMLRYFLSLLNYEEYAPVLEHEKIGIYELPYVSERKLQSFGIPYGPCARIIYEAQQYFISLLTLKSSGIDV